MSDDNSGNGWPREDILYGGAENDSCIFSKNHYGNKIKHVNANNAWGRKTTL